MRWFLDMCVILYSAGEGDRPDLNKKTKKFVEQKGGDDFLLCYYIKEVDIPKYLERQQIILGEIIKKINNDSYALYPSQKASKLTGRDKKKLIKLLLLSKTIGNTEEKIKSLIKLFSELERRINHFLQKYIDGFVVPLGEIDFELKSCLFTWLAPNNSDSKIIASAIQEHNKQRLKIITADKKDWTGDLLREVHNNFKLKKKYSELPKISYIQEM